MHTELLEALGWTLLHSLWQGALIAALLVVVNLFVKRSNVRYVLACAALGVLVLAPAVTLAFLYDKPEQPLMTEQQLLPAPVEVEKPAPADAVETAPSPKQPQVNTPVEPGRSVSWRERLNTYLPFIAAFWVAGVVLLSLRLLLQWLYAERFKRRHTKLVSPEVQQRLRLLALRLSISRPVQLLESSLIDAPTVIGFLKPVILLPASALTGLSVGQLEALLAHELAHVRRHDYLVNILQSVIETLLFYHPAVWWVSHRVRVEREHCCDDVAVQVTGSPVVYAKALERLEHLRQQPKLALAASDGNLLGRIKRILGVKREETRSFGWFTGVVVLGILTFFSSLLGNLGSQAQAETRVFDDLRTTLQAETAKVTESLDSINQLATDEEKVDAFVALAPTLPQSGSAYVAYLKAVASLPSDLKQQAIKALTDVVSKTVGQPDWSNVPDFGSGANINYAEKSLVVATKDAAAIIEFFEPFLERNTEPSQVRNGVAYRYRVLEKATGQEEYGEGIVFENYDRATDSETGKTDVTVASGGNVAHIRAGSIIFHWTRVSEQDGAVFVDYLKPRQFDKSSFETLDLKPFVTDSQNPKVTSSMPPFDIAEVVSRFGEVGDISVILRTAQVDSHVLALQAGKVLSVELLSDNDGYLVIVEHPDGFVSAYGNLQRNTQVKVGDEVAQGELLGYVGGGSLLPYDQLQLYVRNPEGEYVDPLPLFNVQQSETTPATSSPTTHALDVGREPYLWATVRGSVKFSDDYSEVLSTETPDSYIHLEERQRTNRKSLIVKKYKDSPAEYVYTINGQEQPFDEEAKAWYDLVFRRTITQPYVEYEAGLTPAEKITRSSGLMSSFSNDLSLMILESNDVASLMNPTFTDMDGTVTVTHYDSEGALTAINTAVHYAAHNLLAVADEVHDSKIKAFILDMINNVDLEPLAFQKLLLLINEMKAKEAKWEMVSELWPLLPNDLIREQYQQFSVGVPENNLENSSDTVIYGVDAFGPRAKRLLVEDINAKLDEQGLPRFISPLYEISDKQVFSAFNLPFVQLFSPVKDAPVRAMNDGVVKSAQLMSQDDGYMVTLSHPNNITTSYVGLKADSAVKVGQQVKRGETIGYLDGKENESGVLTLYLGYGREGQVFYIDPTSLFELTPSTSQKEDTEQPYSVQRSTPASLDATPDTGSVKLNLSKTPRVVPFTFDPTEMGISEILEQPYNLRVSITDVLGERDLVSQQVPAGEAVNTQLHFFGDATAKLFINDVLFMFWNP
jgi:beta-lactamase regulating signal transducer with metallopeptidase domain